MVKSKDSRRRVRQSPVNVDTISYQTVNAGIDTMREERT